MSTPMEWETTSPPGKDTVSEDKQPKATTQSSQGTRIYNVCFAINMTDTRLGLPLFNTSTVSISYNAGYGQTGYETASLSKAQAYKLENYLRRIGRVESPE